MIDPRVLFTGCRLLEGVLLGAALLAGVGCGSSNKPIVPVQGTIKFSDGQLLPPGTKLMFEPVEGRTGTATATVEADGRFVATHVSGRSGVETGKYIVQLVPPPEQQKEFFRLISPEVAEGYLTADIHEGMGMLALTVPRSTAVRKK